MVRRPPTGGQGWPGGGVRSRPRTPPARPAAPRPRCPRVPAGRPRPARRPADRPPGPACRRRLAVAAQALERRAVPGCRQRQQARVVRDPEGMVPPGGQHPTFGVGLEQHRRTVRAASAALADVPVRPGRASRAATAVAPGDPLPPATAMIIRPRRSGSAAAAGAPRRWMPPPPGPRGPGARRTGRSPGTVGRRDGPDARRTQLRRHGRRGLTGGRRFDHAHGVAGTQGGRRVGPGLEHGADHGLAVGHGVAVADHVRRQHGPRRDGATGHPAHDEVEVGGGTVRAPGRRRPRRSRPHRPRPSRRRPRPRAAISTGLRDDVARDQAANPVRPEDQQQTEGRSRGHGAPASPAPPSPCSSVPRVAIDSPPSARRPTGAPRPERGFRERHIGNVAPRSGPPTATLREGRYGGLHLLQYRPATELHRDLGAVNGAGHHEGEHSPTTSSGRPRARFQRRSRRASAQGRSLAPWPPRRRRRRCCVRTTCAGAGAVASTSAATSPSRDGSCPTRSARCARCPPASPGRPTPETGIPAPLERAHGQVARAHRADAPRRRPGRRGPPPGRGAWWGPASPPTTSTCTCTSWHRRARRLPEPAQLQRLPEERVHLRQRGDLPRHPRRPGPPGRRHRQPRRDGVHRRRARRHQRHVLRRRRRPESRSSCGSPRSACGTASRRWSRAARSATSAGPSRTTPSRHRYGVVRAFIGHGIGEQFHTDLQIHHYYDPRPHDHATGHDVHDRADDHARHVAVPHVGRRLDGGDGRRQAHGAVRAHDPRDRRRVDADRRPGRVSPAPRRR